MKKEIRKLGKRGTSSARKLVKKVEKSAMAAVGRRAVRSKVKAAARSGRKLVKVGMVAATSAVTGAILAEVKPLRKFGARLRGE